MTDERRFHDRRRPSDAQITAEHNRILRARQLAEIEITAEGVRNALHNSEPGGDDADSTPGRSPERERVRAALRRLAAGPGRRAGRAMRPAVSPPPVGDSSNLEEVDEAETPVIDPENATRREFLRSRGVDVDHAKLVMHPVQRTGPGTTIRPPIELDHPPPITRSSRR